VAFLFYVITLKEYEVAANKIMLTLISKSISPRMKKITFTAVVFCIAVFLFCCKTYKSSILPEQREEVNNEISDYLRSASGVMHNSTIPQKDPNIPATASAKKDQPVYNLHPYKMPTLADKKNVNGDEPVLTKKEERKAIKAMLKKQLAADGDGDGVGIAIGLLILYVLLGILIIVLLFYLIASAANNSANNSSNGSGSGSNTGSGGSGSNSGCYVATMVYGSYDAPEVMVLRRFRDTTLSNSKAGRAFIRWYYSWSPGFVEKYHHLSWLHKIIKVILNRLVKFLS
jgi:hypothetical protein